MDIFDAARSNEVTALRSFIDAGQINSIDARGSSPLIIAGYYGHLEAVNCLLQYGADTEIKDSMGNTALMGVCFKGYLAVAAALCEQGAVIDHPNGNGATALTFAATFGQNEIIRLLLHKGANPLHRDHFGKNPVDYALLQGNAAGYEMLARAANERIGIPQ
ncbi:hypothetical protein SAMN05421788_113153 [Filimonas lacunae]|uniref:Uncharacterized protein n=1 Tax=Filimonas lacunae TaxID=477680 RepID=A0A173MBF7_9BACT|nr:ankyrin repeat domain-containing protein [Filimonas lacunae]BAV04894.1 ankyrin-like protein [Filimonas lacunae]SIT33839.1 hypothetical protein SAMN05421788_113153 [Filimonas lacunae]